MFLQESVLTLFTHRISFAYRLRSATTFPFFMPNRLEDCLGLWFNIVFFIVNGSFVKSSAKWFHHVHNIRLFLCMSSGNQNFIDTDFNWRTAGSSILHTCSIFNSRTWLRKCVGTKPFKSSSLRSLSGDFKFFSQENLYCVIEIQ